MKKGQGPLANSAVRLREEFDDWAVLFNLDAGKGFGLNPTGVFIWKLLDGRHAVDDIIDRLRKEAEDVPDDVHQHISEFIRTLEKEGLVGYEAEGA